MSGTQTTYAKAVREYDQGHERELLEAIAQALLQTSKVSDVDACASNRRSHPGPNDGAGVHPRYVRSDALAHGHSQDDRRFRQKPAPQDFLGQAVRRPSGLHRRTFNGNGPEGNA